MKFLRFLLFPFSLIYWGITALRNWFYQIGLTKASKYAIPIINVGNLSMGGTGKTPHTEYLIRLLKDEYELASLSRGYGRKTTGYQYAAPHASSEQIGDEPAQYKNKFDKELHVAVDEDRVRGMVHLLGEHESIDVVLLDDSYQHRAIKPGLNILLTTYNEPFYQDFIVPVGNLRESRRGKNRADIIVVSKCPEGLSSDEKQLIKDKINLDVPIFFSSISYGDIIPLGKESKPFEEVVLVTGIAKPQPLENHLKKEVKISQHFNFKDHHRFTSADVDKIHEIFGNLAGSNKAIITTEKDAMRLKDVMKADDFDAFNWHYQEMKILMDKPDEFDRLIKDYVRETRRDNELH